MAGRLPVDRAEERLHHALGRGRQTPAGLDPDAAWRRFVRFGSRRFDTAPGGDGLLLQYGTYAFEGPPLFTLDLARQFEINDAAGEHDHFIQLHCEFRYEPVPELRALGQFEDWFFHDTDDELDRWADGLGNRGFWPIVRTHRPREVRVYQEQV
ncbi:hypothetical protein [Streptomyces sp. NPDC046925]|uniref:hypothetical protein n=1 Tax=Streptomyces sp. NPDC046925 TaxID=3155375 RepID=UPI0033F217C4